MSPAPPCGAKVVPHLRASVGVRASDGADLCPAGRRPHLEESHRSAQPGPWGFLSTSSWGRAEAVAFVCSPVGSPANKLGCWTLQREAGSWGLLLTPGCCGTWTVLSLQGACPGGRALSAGPWFLTTEFACGLQLTRASLSASHTSATGEGVFSCSSLGGAAPSSGSRQTPAVGGTSEGGTLFGVFFL